MPKLEVQIPSPDQCPSYIDAIVQLLGGPTVLGTEISTKSELEDAVHSGLPIESASTLLSILDGADRDKNCEVTSWLSEQFIPDDIDRVGLSSRSSNKALRVASLLVALLGIFGDIETAIHYLLSPHPALGGQVPVQAVFSNSGVKEVEALILSGLHGLPA